MFKKLITMVLVMGLTADAFGLDRCKQLVIMEGVIDKTASELAGLEKMHQMRVKAQKIREQLLDAEDESSILNQEERLIAELAATAEEQSTNQKIEVASVGGIMLFPMLFGASIAILAGQALLRRIKLHLLPKDRRILRHFLSFGLIVSSAHAVYVGMRMYDNHKKQVELGEIIKELNQIADLTGKITKLRDNLETHEIKYELLLESLNAEGRLQYTEQGERLCSDS